MTTSKKFLLAGVLSLAGVVLPAAAHHSFAMFDKTKTVHADGATVSKFRWTNPHSFVVVDVKDAKGTTSYTLECNSINLMSRAGWKVNTLKAGDKVSVDYYPLRDGKPGGMLKTITLPDGRTLKAW
jgi:hypothetical protein